MYIFFNGPFLGTPSRGCRGYLFWVLFYLGRYYFSGMLASYSYRSYNESIMSLIHSILSTPERGHKVIAFTLFVLFRYLSFSHMPFASLSKSIGTIQSGTYQVGVWSQEFWENIIFKE